MSDGCHGLFLFVFVLLLLSFFHFVNVCVNNSDCGYVHHIAYGTFEVCEVNRFVESHLNWANDFRVGI